MSISVVILAAGKGTRMRSKLPKVLQSIAGKPLLWHVINTATRIESENTVVVYGHEGERVKKAFDDKQVTWIEQAEQLGTGHAVQVALEALPRTGQSIILYGDVPLIQAKTLQKLHEASINHERQNLSMITLHVDNPEGLGRIVRDESDQVVAIVEEKDANEYQRHIKEVNTGIYCVDNSLLHELVPELTNDNAQGEYYLTDIVKMAAKKGAEIKTVKPLLNFEIDGVNNRLQLSTLERKWQRYLATELQTQGIQLADPERIDIRGTLRCGQDVYIDTNVIFEGNCVLGDNVTIGAGCVIKDSTIDAGATIKPYCVIDDSHVGQHATVGPFAHLRPGSRLAEDTKVGNFVETKKAHLGKGSKVNHLSYVGDAQVGKGVNIGAGVITCNYDGANKHVTTLADNVFVGSNASLVAPINIGQGATIGAGSVITKDVEENQLAVARNRQRAIADYRRPSKK